VPPRSESNIVLQYPLSPRKARFDRPPEVPLLVQAGLSAAIALASSIWSANALPLWRG